MLHNEIETDGFCNGCINPMGFKKSKKELVGFHKRNNMLFCEPCLEQIDHPVSSKTLRAEMKEYLDNHSKLLFAYSGGLDSTVVLVGLTLECRKRNIKLDVFTVETGVNVKLSRGDKGDSSQISRILHFPRSYDIIKLCQEQKDFFYPKAIIIL